jgi:NAD(P)-dependent dehydrogenase (short-subunit alcohol dehydrogenase family)
MSGVMIVTGAGRGIGAATARLAGQRGYAVAVNYRTAQQQAEALAVEIESAGGRAIVVQGDVAEEADVVRLFRIVDDVLGPVTALVNNAGITGPVRKVADIDLPTLRGVFDINVIGCFLCAREAVRRMSTERGGRGGAIVNVSSRASGLGSGGEFIHYAASKGAVDSFTIGLAREVAREGIRVNAVNPGLIDTEIHEGDRLARIAPSVPMARAGTAGEVAEAVLWLLSDAASYVTGTFVHVSGGR